jgi:hypothetical protein
MGKRGSRDIGSCVESGSLVLLSLAALYIFTIWIFLPVIGWLRELAQYVFEPAPENLKILAEGFCWWCS